MKPRSSLTAWRQAAIALVLIAGAWALRAGFTERVFWNLDEGVTFTLAQQIRAGDVLYRDAVDHRGPLVPYLKAAALAVVGDWNFAAVHQLLGLGLGLFAFGLYRLAARLGDPRTGLAAAIVFSVLSLVIQGPAEAMALHTEWFMEAFSLVGFLLFAARLKHPTVPAGIAAGACFGLAALNKQPGLLDYGVLVVLTILLAVCESDRRRGWLRFLAGTAVGVCLPFLIAWLYFAAHGAAEGFRWYAWTYNTAIYVPEIPLPERLPALYLPLGLLRQNAPLILGAAVGGLGGLLFLAFSGIRPALRGSRPFPVLVWLTLGWGAAGWISSALSGRTFSHYALHILPGASLAAGWFLARLWPARNDAGQPRLRWLRLAIIAVGAVLTLWSSARIQRAIRDEPDPAAVPLREFADVVSAPSDRWFVWGYYPEVYGWAQRLPATRFNYANFLTGLIPWTNVAPEVDTAYAVAPGAWDQLAADFDLHPPAVVISSNARHYTKYPLFAQPWLRDWLPPRFAELSTEPLRRTGFRAFVRLGPAEAETPLDEIPLDPTLRPRVRLEDLDAHHPLIRIEIPVTASTRHLRLFVDDTPVRTFTPPAAPGALVAFFIPFAELQERQSDALSLVVTEVEASRRSTVLPVARLLDLDRTAFLARPRFRWGEQDIVVSTLTGDWRLEARNGHWGWRTTGPASLRLTPPPAAQRLQWIREGDASPTVSADLPDGSSAELAVQPYPGTGQAVIFGPDPIAGLTLSVGAGKSLWLGDLVADAIGPVLHLGAEDIHPVHSEIGVGGVPTTQDHDRWFMHAPARVHYQLRPGLTGVVMRYGFIEDTWERPPDHPTTGAEFRLEHLHTDGTREVLFRRYLNPVTVEPDRGLQEVAFPLIRRGEGELQFVIDEGEFDERSGDWTYLANGRLLGPGPDITAPNGLRFTPRSGTFGAGEIIDTRTPEGWWDAHAPSRLTYDYPAQLGSVTLLFGFKEGAWAGRVEPHVTDGIDLIVERLAPDGTTTELHRTSWNPASNPAHRGPLSVRVDLPPPGAGDRLVIRTTTGPAGNEEFDWTLWGPFTGTLRAAP